MVWSWLASQSLNSTLEAKGINQKESEAGQSKFELFMCGKRLEELAHILLAYVVNAFVGPLGLVIFVDQSAPHTLEEIMSLHESLAHCKVVDKAFFGCHCP